MSFSSLLNTNRKRSDTEPDPAYTQLIDDITSDVTYNEIDDVTNGNHCEKEDVLK